MTQGEWATGTDPAPMLAYLKAADVSERKLRLLACACCRRVWEHLPDPRSRRAVEVAERFADELATQKDLAKAHNNALVVKGGAAWAPYWATSTKAGGPLLNVFQFAAEAPARQATRLTQKYATWETVQAQSLREQAELIREVVGDPYREPWLSPAWLAWEGGVVAGLAEGIYAEGAFERMPFLGDALEEAGCGDRAVLDHCRRGGPHVRGCWVLDWVLGKE